MSNKVGKNARRDYRQQLLSGWSDFGKPENWDSGSPPEVKPAIEEGFTRKQTAYQISLPVVIEQISLHGDELLYTIRLNDDVDLPISTYSKRSKKAVEPSTTIPRKNIKGSVSVPMVYGVQPGGQYSLSHTVDNQTVKLSTAIYSHLLEQVDRAVECLILKLEKQETNDDARKRKEGTQSPKNLGTNQETRWGKALRAKVLSETVPEESTGMDGSDR